MTVTDEPLDAAEFAPVLLLEVDLAQPLPDVVFTHAETGQRYSLAQSLVRVHTQPLGYVSLAAPPDAGHIEAAAYARIIWAELQPQIIAYLQKHALPVITTLTTDGLSKLGTPQYLQERERLLQNAPFVSVVVTTRERPGSLTETLRSIADLVYPNYEIIVVDNAPTTTDTVLLIDQLVGEIPHLRYIREDRRGLCWARNCGLDNAQGEITVFTDDDVLVDRHWLTALVQGFKAGDRVGCVTGLILPRELETPAQVWCEEHGGFGKGFLLRVFDLDQNRPDDVLYPYRVSIFGSGANMAFRTDALRTVGGADPALGAGTLTLSAAEFPAFYKILRRGYQIVYQPEAIVYHSHHKEYQKFRRQFYGYGVGFTAFLTKCILENPLTFFDLLRRLPYGLYFTFSPRSPRHGAKSARYPKELNRLEIRGMFYGPIAYLRSRYRVYRAKKTVGAAGKAKPSQ